MKIRIGVILALVLIVAVSYWTLDAVRERSYEGSNLTFKVGSGSVAVTNPSDEAIPVQMRATGRTSTFRIESPELELNKASTREGSGRNIFHVANFDLEPGKYVINVTRGSGLEFVSETDTSIQAVVTPLTSSQVRTRLIMAAVVILGALFYISSSFEHKWVGTVRSKLPIGGEARSAATS